MKILIVDDSKAMRSIVLRTLRQAGYESHTFLEAQNGGEALKMIRESVPDLVFSDWNMPEMSGIDLLKAVRADNIQVAFGFVTSESSGEIMKAATDAGAKFFVTKPFTPEAFQKAISVAIGC